MVCPMGGASRIPANNVEGAVRERAMTYKKAANPSNPGKNSGKAATKDASKSKADKKADECVPNCKYASNGNVDKAEECIARKCKDPSDSKADKAKECVSNCINKSQNGSKQSQDTIRKKCLTYVIYTY